MSCLATHLDKIGELKQLLSLYETAIVRQQNLLDKVKRGKFKSSQVSDEILLALVTGDLKILTDKKEQAIKDIAKLESEHNISPLNGTGSSKPDEDSDD